MPEYMTFTVVSYIPVAIIVVAALVWFVWNIYAVIAVRLFAQRLNMILRLSEEAGYAKIAITTRKEVEELRQSRIGRFAERRIQFMMHAEVQHVYHVRNSRDKSRAIETFIVSPPPAEEHSMNVYFYHIQEGVSTLPVVLRDFTYEGVVATQLLTTDYRRRHKLSDEETVQVTYAGDIIRYRLRGYDRTHPTQSGKHYLFQKSTPWHRHEGHVLALEEISNSSADIPTSGQYIPCAIFPRDDGTIHYVWEALQRHTQNTMAVEQRTL